MLWTFIAVFAFVILLPGCAALGLQTADTFNQKLAYAYGQVTAARKGATSVINASCPTSEQTEACKAAVADGKHVQAMADEARQGLDLAKSYALAGNTQQANVQLQLETAALTALQTYLLSKGVK
jgi:anti-sigma factor RsiW